jgi:hypothetical protein
VSSLTGGVISFCLTENERAELLRALEQTLSKLKATKDPGQRRSFLRKMTR